MQHAGRQVDAAEECQGTVVPGGDATPLLEPGVSTFHGVAQLVVVGVKARWSPTA